MTEERIYLRHLGLMRPRYCHGGARSFFKRHGLDWDDFRRNGIDCETLLKTGDAMATRVVEEIYGQRRK